MPHGLTVLTATMTGGAVGGSSAAGTACCGGWCPFCPTATATAGAPTAAAAAPAAAGTAAAAAPAAAGLPAAGIPAVGAGAAAVPAAAAPAAAGGLGTAAGGVGAAAAGPGGAPLLPGLASVGAAAGGGPLLQQAMGVVAGLFMLPSKTSSILAKMRRGEDVDDERETEASDGETATNVSTPPEPLNSSSISCCFPDQRTVKKMSVEASEGPFAVLTARSSEAYCRFL